MLLSTRMLLLMATLLMAAATARERLHHIIDKIIYLILAIVGVPPTTIFYSRSLHFSLVINNYHCLAERNWKVRRAFFGDHVGEDANIGGENWGFF